MAILNIQPNEPGQTGVKPGIVRIETNDTVETITTPGYLTKAVQSGLVSFQESDLCAVVTRLTPNARDSQAGWYEIKQDSGSWSLVPPAQAGNVDLPTQANRIAHFTNTTGTLSSDPADVNHLGNLELGNDAGTKGSILLRPATPGTGGLRVEASPNAGPTDVIITNAGMGQAVTATIPDPASTAANFLLDTGPGNTLPFQQFIGPAQITVPATAGGSFVRLSQAQYVYRIVGPSAGTLNLAMDVTIPLRIAANKGYSLRLLDVIYSIGGVAATSHTITMDTVRFVDGVAVAVTTIPVTGGGALETAVAANPYVTQVGVTPGFLNTSNTKEVIELGINLGAVTTYDLFGVMLSFDQTIA